ncbi:MAG: GDP-mannose 6-dehydrogenase [Gaiellaceae bacterium]|jgi:GDP-mannose 6-dehydrogenase|nr:GDP-mannose 6-dehydrogenase [Gaiellaceae bacterium]
MRVAVFGLGYVGSVSAAALASLGHEVIGVDSNPEKVELVGAGGSPVLEPGLREEIAEAVASGALRATTDPQRAIDESDISLICVGTPSAANGSLSTAALERVTESIGRALRSRRGTKHVVVVRSTVLPGTAEKLVLPLLESASGGRAGETFGLANNPEFLREGTSLEDFFDPPKTVIGELDEWSGDVVESLYEEIGAPVFRVPLKTAEMLKYVDNAFHALKIGFANEVGAICEAFDVDAQEVMHIFRADTKLNISPSYLMPGFAFGGSCLPKDLRALVHAARRADVDAPILEHVLPSNERHLRRTFEAIARTGARRVGLFGLSFKPGTDDLRESPLVDLAERLVGKGFTLKIYDPGVSLARLVGANRDYVAEHLPHLSTLLCDSAEEVVEHAEVCVLGAAMPEALAALDARNGYHLIDLAQGSGDPRGREDVEVAR